MQISLVGVFCGNGKGKKRPASKTMRKAKILPSAIHMVFLRNTSVGRFLTPPITVSYCFFVLDLTIARLICSYGRRLIVNRILSISHTQPKYIQLSWCIVYECGDNVHNPILLGDAAMADGSCWDLVCTWIHRDLGRWSGVVCVVLGLWDTMTYW